MKNAAREEEWAAWMRSAIAGDGRAYHRLLTAVTPYLRVIVIIEPKTRKVVKILE